MQASHYAGRDVEGPSHVRPRHAIADDPDARVFSAFLERSDEYIRGTFAICLMWKLAV